MHALPPNKQQKLADLNKANLEDDIISWTVPKKAQLSPVVFDKPITVDHPKIRLPRSLMQKVHQHGKSNPEREAAAVQKHQKTVADENLQFSVEEGERKTAEHVHVTGDNKREFSGVSDAVQSHEEEEITCWSGPPKTPYSPIHIDRPIIITDPVIRLPRRSFESSKAENGNSKKSEQYADISNGSGRGNKRKFSDNNDTYQSQEVPPKVILNDEDDDIISWTGPVKTPHSPIQTDKPILVTDPVARLPRRIFQSSTSQSGKVQKKQKSKADNNAKQNEISTHMPPRDPLMHKPIVTPPCPIKQSPETPANPPTYTHVSIYITVNLKKVQFVVFESSLL